MGKGIAVGYKFQMGLGLRPVHRAAPQECPPEICLAAALLPEKPLVPAYSPCLGAQHAKGLHQGTHVGRGCHPQKVAVILFQPLGTAHRHLRLHLPCGFQQLQHPACHRRIFRGEVQSQIRPGAYCHGRPHAQKSCQLRALAAFPPDRPMGKLVFYLGSK